MKELKSSSKSNKIKPPINKHILITKHFSIFFNLKTKLSDFCVIGHAN
jgi:hypothetical protein